MKRLVCILLFLASYEAFGQNPEDSLMLKANMVTKKYLKNSAQLDYLLYNVDEFYVFIVNSGNKYKQYLVDIKQEKIDSSIVSEDKNKIFRVVFSKPLSPCNFLYFERDSIIRFGHYPFLHNMQRMEYFVLVKKGVKYIEYCVPSLFVENDPKRSWYPIDKKLRIFLFGIYGNWLIRKEKI